MTMENLAVTIELKRGVGSILEHSPMDGLLAHLWFERLKRKGRFDGDYSQELPFLERDPSGFYRVSPLYYRVRAIENRTLYKSFDAKGYERAFGKGKITATHRRAASGPWRVHMDGFEVSHVESARFYLRGDRAVVADLLSDLTHLGKKRSNGMGAVKSVTVAPIEEDLSVTDARGRLVRHVPAESAAGAEGPLKFAPATHPYWDRGRERVCRAEGGGGRPLLSPGEDSPLLNPPRHIAESFGFRLNHSPVKKRGVERIEGNETYRCRMCGRVQPSGYLDPKRRLIGSNSNDLYRYAHRESPFLCDYCHYNGSHYMKKMQKGLDRVYGDMADVVITASEVRRHRFLSDERNELYDLLVSPPGEPFILLVRALAGTSIVNGTYRALPTLDADLFAVNYGADTLFVSPRKVFEALEAWERIGSEAKAMKVKFSDDLLFNRNGSEKYMNWYTPRLANNEWFEAAARDFVSRYDRPTRIVAKMVARRWAAERRKSKTNTKE